jgi:hypothetical protein
MTGVVSDSIRAERFSALLMAALGGLALILGRLRAFVDLACDP